MRDLRAIFASSTAIFTYLVGFAAIQFGRADGGQQAHRPASGARCSAKGDHRDTHQQRLARCCGAVVGVGVKRDVRTPP